MFYYPNKMNPKFSYVVLKLTKTNQYDDYRLNCIKHSEANNPCSDKCKHI